LNKIEGVCYQTKGAFIVLHNFRWTNMMHLHNGFGSYDLDGETCNGSACSELLLLLRNGFKSGSSACFEEADSGTLRILKAAIPVYNAS
jgi:hypothetical protein